MEVVMTRFSIIKQKQAVDYSDFIHFMNVLIQAFKNAGCASPGVEIVFYKKLPHSRTTLEDVWEEARQRNEDAARRLMTVSSIHDAVPSLFDAAVSVHVHIKPESSDDHDTRYVHFECLGLLPKHAVFYIQPDDIGERMKEEILLYAQSFKLPFDVGDGLERSHSTSLY
jgi:hypothetical protein